MQDPIESSWTKPDRALEKQLRPESLQHFCGQEKVRERLSIVISAAKARGEPAPHTLFFGPPGLGKTTLAHIVASEMGTHLVTASGPSIEKAGDLAGMMTSLQEGDVFFIDEIHRLSKTVEEYLYSAMEDFRLDLTLDSGQSARTVQVGLNRFTLVGATTRAGLVSSPLRTRFGFQCRLDYYSVETLTAIISRSAKILSFAINSEGAKLIAERSRGTPRIANNLMRWVRDFAQNQGAFADRETVEAALKMLAIDAKGLDEMDVKILETLIDHHAGGPVGLKTLAAAVGEEDATLSEMYEPYLITLGMLQRTPRGRVATMRAYEHLGRKNV